MSALVTGSNPQTWRVCWHRQSVGQHSTHQSDPCTRAPTMSGQAAHGLPKHTSDSGTKKSLQSTNLWRGSAWAALTQMTHNTAPPISATRGKQNKSLYHHQSLSKQRSATRTGAGPHNRDAGHSQSLARDTTRQRMGCGITTQSAKVATGLESF